MKLINNNFLIVYRLIINYNYTVQTRQLSLSSINHFCLDKTKSLYNLQFGVNDNINHSFDLSLT